MESEPNSVLVILHQAHSVMGQVGPALEAHGLTFDIRRPLLGDPLPETLAEHRAAVVFGGPNSANEETLRPELDWLAVPLKEQKPLLGICLGGQLLAKHLGGSVNKDPKERVEVGYHPVQATKAGEDLMAWPSMVYQWHRESMEPPASALVLAEGTGPFACQAFTHDCRSAGLQFHPDVDLAMLNRWCGKATHMLDSQGAQPHAEQLRDFERFDAPLNAWFREFLKLWLAEKLC